MYRVELINKAIRNKNVSIIQFNNKLFYTYNLDAEPLIVYELLRTIPMPYIRTYDENSVVLPKNKELLFRHIELQKKE